MDRGQMLLLLSLPETWPLYPKLPVKRVVEGDRIEHGTILAYWPDFNVPNFTVYRIGFPDVEAADLSRAPASTYSSWAMAVDDGWRVD